MQRSYLTCLRQRNATRTNQQINKSTNQQINSKRSVSRIKQPSAARLTPYYFFFSVLFLGLCPLSPTFSLIQKICAKSW